MNHKRELITDGPKLWLQANDDGVWLHFSTSKGKHSSINLPLKFGYGKTMSDAIICEWSVEFAEKNKDAPKNNAEGVAVQHPTAKGMQAQKDAPATV